MGQTTKTFLCKEQGPRCSRAVRTRSFPFPPERTGRDICRSRWEEGPLAYGSVGSTGGTGRRAVPVSLTVTPSPTPAFYPSWLNEKGLVCLVSKVSDSKTGRRGVYSSKL